MANPQERALEAERQVGLINAFFPILPMLGNRWAASRPWEDRTIALNMHLTSLTAALVRELILGGGRFVVSAASPATTHGGTVDLLRNLGVEVYTGGDMRNRHLQVLDHDPDVLVDVGFELVDTLLEKRPEQAASVRGAIEVTRSGITRLRRASDIPFPVVNINDGRLKDAVENRHGVGQAVWQALSTLTGMHLAGRRAAVIGYGPVGRGLAMYGRAAGVSVEVVETDPVRRLFAHYDGFPTPVLSDALTRANCVVTATGSSRAVIAGQLTNLGHDLVLVNAGHGGDEIDVEDIRSASTREDNISDGVVRFHLRAGGCVTLLGNGHPLNIVLNSGSPEPVLLHFAVLGLALQQVVASDLPPGEVTVPDDIEREAATLALRALGTAGA